MTAFENLMVTAMEECAEIQKECAELQQEISKALRFGLEGRNPLEPDLTNRERILKEYIQLQVVMDLLSNTTALGSLSDEEVKEIETEKLANLRKYGELSKKLGLLE